MIGINYHQIKIFENGWLLELLRQGPTTFKINTDISFIDIATCLVREPDIPELPKAMDYEFISHAFCLLIWSVTVSLIVLTLEIHIQEFINILESN